MARCGNPVPQEFQAYNDRERDLEIAKLMRAVELLQRQLEHQQNHHQQKRNRHEARKEEEDQNPFGVDDDSSDEDHVNLRQRRQPNRRDRNVKVDVPEFNGKMQCDVFLDWLYTIERIFDFKEYSEERKVKQDNYVKFYNFKQYNLPVEEYIREFEYLMLRSDINEPEEQTIARFLGGLKRDIANVIRLQPYWSFNDVRKLVINVEQQWMKYSLKTATKPISSNPGSASSIPSKTFTKGVDRSKTKTKREGGSIQRTTNTFNATRKCFKCQWYGHIASKCPNHKMVTIIEDMIKENEEELNEE
ncbi:hypothetical protein LWI28_005047 [Acer negundo]|uniref:CCHC-type domain-containing protein n=1 Tax=Acer negundo TaxID=4023 RepID=A0AAD5I9E1_ACENE|nr:hypothetical protein LWI28_005047 [Acer negundo]